VGDPLHPLVPVNGVEATPFKGSGEMLGAVCLDKSLLEELREVTLVYSGLPGVGLLVVTQDDPPGSLEWGKDAHIQWLELVCRVGRETDESDVVGPA